MINKVYFIDDDEICLMSSQFILAESHFADNCMVFSDPQEALVKLRKDLAEDELPEIIILDLHIPKMSGWDFLEALKPFELTLRNKCFIYVLTSSLNESELARVKNCSLVFELIRKPFTPEKLNQIMQNIVIMKS